MAHSNALVRWLLPWIAVLFASATLAYTITSAIAGGSPVQESGAAIGGSPTSVGVDWWIVAESQRNERGTYAVLDSPAATPTHHVLSSIVSTVPESIAFPNRDDLLQSLDTEYETSLAAIPGGPIKTQGI